MPQHKETLSTLASELGLPVSVLLKQLALAKVGKHGPNDPVSEQDKTRLLDYLRIQHKASQASQNQVKGGGKVSQGIVGTITVNKLARDLRMSIEGLRRLLSTLGIKARDREDKLFPDETARVVDYCTRHMRKDAVDEKPNLPPTVAVPAARPVPRSSLDYDWPGQFTPFEHQIKTTEFLIQYDRAFCLNDMGTGKTLSVLWAFDYLRQRRKVQSMLIICPLSTMVRTWQDEIVANFQLRARVLHGVDGMARRKVLGQPADIYIINHDGIKIPGMIDALNLRPDIDLIVVDEIAQVGRNAGTDRYKALRSICNNQSARKVWGLTGTPTPNHPTDAWAQCRLLVPDRVPLYFNRFKDQVMRQVSQYLWVPRPEALAIVQEAMQPSIMFRREACLDLPPVLFETREIELTPEQKKAYQEMLTKLRTEVRGKVIDAKTLLVMATKLLQIACGAAYKNADGKRETVFIPAKRRLSEMLSVIEEARASVIVFVPFVGVLEAVRDYLKSKSVKFAEIHGGVPHGERNEIIRMFQTEKSIPVLIASPGAMSHGLNLTAANTIIWFGPITKNEVMQQANARIMRPGQIYNQLVVFLEGSEIEELIYTRLRNKQDFQEALLKLFEAKALSLETQNTDEPALGRPVW